MAGDPCARPDDPALLSLDQALAHLRSTLQPIAGVEHVGIEQACGRILAHDLLAAVDAPPFANAAMDGYALRSSDTSQASLREQAILQLVGTSWAGHPYRGACEPDQCVRIYTGAAIPQGSDAVIMQEEVRTAKGYIMLDRAVAPGELVRARGRDVQIGQEVLSRGRRLNGMDVGLIAAMGLPEIKVHRPLRVSVLATGDELRNPGADLDYGEIYDSNRYSLKAFLHALKITVTDLGSLPDDAESLTTVLTDASHSSDVIITIGGASVGDADHLVPVLRTLGDVDLWKIAIKPGKPFAYGRIGTCDVFGLPGNPVSAIVTFLQLVRPALLQRMGAQPEPVLRLSARLTLPVVKPVGRMEFQRAWFAAEADGSLSVTPLPGQDADRQSTLSRANCFLIIPAASNGADSGAAVMIEPFLNYL